MAFLKEYEKIRVVGKGSFAKIWKVRHIKYGYIRAIKVSNEMVDDDDDPAYRTFVEECKVLLKIGSGSHPNIVHIYQPRLIDNRAIVEMDYVEGETLNEYLHRVLFVPMAEVYRFIDEIVGALAYCHHDIYQFLMDPENDDLVSDPNDGSKYIIDSDTEKRLVRKYAVTHNDLHSNNVMRRSYDEHYVLLDFGLAIQDGKAVKSSSRRGGALEYMPPEKFDDSSVITTQSDVYSLGILLYEILAGRVPFVLDEQLFESNPVQMSHQLMTQHKTALPPDLFLLRREAFEKAHPGEEYQTDFPKWLEQVINRCLAKKPADRYADAKELFDDIKRLKAENPDNASDAHTLINNNQNLLQQISVLTHEVENLKQDNETLKNAALSERETSTERVKNLTGQTEQQQTIIQDLNTQLSQLQNSTDQLKQRCSSAENAASKAKQDIAKLKQENENLKKNSGKRKSRVGWIIATILFLLTTIAGIAGTGYFAYLYEETDWELQKAQKSTGSTYVDEQYQQQVADLEQQIEQLQLQLQNGDNADEINRLNKQIEQLQQENTNLLNSNSSANNNSQQTISQLNKQISSLTHEINRLKNSNSSANNNNQQTINQLNQKINQLNQKVNQLQSENKAKDAQVKRLTNLLENQ